MTPEGRQDVYKIDLPKRVSKQLDKVPNKDYTSVSKAIKNLKETPRPSGCKKLYESLIAFALATFESSIGLMTETKPL